MGLKAFENYWGLKKPLFLLHTRVVSVSFIDDLFSLHTLTPLTLLLGKQVQFHGFQHARTEMTHQILHSQQCPGKNSSVHHRVLQFLAERAVLSPSSDCQTWRLSLPTYRDSSLKFPYMQNSAEYTYSSTISNISSTVVESQPWSPIPTYFGWQKLLKKHFSDFTKYCC